MTTRLTGPPLRMGLFATPQGFLGLSCPVTALLLIHCSSVATLDSAVIFHTYMKIETHSVSKAFCDLNLITLCVTEISLQILKTKWLCNLNSSLNVVLLLLLLLWP